MDCYNFCIEAMVLEVKGLYLSPSLCAYVRLVVGNRKIIECDTGYDNGTVTLQRPKIFVLVLVSPPQLLCRPTPLMPPCFPPPNPFASSSSFHLRTPTRKSVPLGWPQNAKKFSTFYVTPYTFVTFPKKCDFGREEMDNPLRL